MSDLYARMGFIYARGSDGLVHLADESPFGWITGCDVAGWVTRVEAVPAEDVCIECRADADAIRAEVDR